MITNSIGMKLVLIPKGTFMMGSPIGEDCGNEGQHQVTISKDYYLGATPVTIAQYEKVTGRRGYCGLETESDMSVSDRLIYPVACIPWEHAVEFCEKLSDLPAEKKEGRKYRLPTEAEWEYGCRAGSNTAYSFGATAELLGDYAWFGENSGRHPRPVGEKKPNAWGLYDMHGNVWEYCSDWYGEYTEGAVTDPTGPKEGDAHVIRGGSCNYSAAECRSAYRFERFYCRRRRFYGFRVVLGLA
jgi:formylglycine-generating enzyme required for sulfatase activity